MDKVICTSCGPRTHIPIPSCLIVMMVRPGPMLRESTTDPLSTTILISQQVVMGAFTLYGRATCPACLVQFSTVFLMVRHGLRFHIRDCRVADRLLPSTRKGMSMLLCAI